MLVYKCPKCGGIYDKKDVSQNELCPSCGVYLKIVNIKKRGKYSRAMNSLYLARWGGLLL